jgi:hypothetical protein
MSSSGLELPHSAKPLVVPINILPGEGLPQAIIRAAAANSYYQSKLVVRAAGVSGYASVGSAGTWASGIEEALATTLGVPGGSADIRRLLHAPDKQRKGWHEFFGAHIRVVHRVLDRRRVSPRALRVSQHCRAMWSIRPFSFDPATKEYLLDKCPVCGRHFGYVHTVGMAHCEHCLTTDHEGFIRGRVDLRDFPQPLVSVDDVEALDFVTGLIDPDPEVRAAFSPTLPDRLRSYDRGALFEFAIALACAITSDPEWQGGFLSRPKSNADYARFTPAVLSTAGRIILSWPSGFDRLAERVRAGADKRSSHYGLRKELGPLVGLTVDPYIEPGLRALAREAISRNMANTSVALATVRRKDNLFRSDLVTVQQAAARFKVTRKFMACLAKNPSLGAKRIECTRKSPILMSAALLDELFSKRADLVPASSVVKALHIPTPALASIAEAGLLRCERDPLCLPPGQYFGRRSVDELVASLTSKLRLQQVPDGALSLVEAAVLLGSPDGNPWMSLLASVLEGHLPVWTRKAVGLANRIMLPSLDEVRQAVQPRPWMPRDGSLALTDLDIMLLLGSGNKNSAGTLIRKGYIPNKPCLQHVKIFSAKYMLTVELRRILAARGVSSSFRAVSSTLISESVFPAARLTHKTLSLLLWDRAEVEAFLRNRFPIQEVSLV